MSQLKEAATSILWRIHSTGLEYFFTQWTSPRELEKQATAEGLDPAIMHRILVAARAYLEARVFLLESLERLQKEYGVTDDDIEG